MERKRKPLVEGTRRSELKISFIRNCGVHWPQHVASNFFLFPGEILVADGEKKPKTIGANWRLHFETRELGIGWETDD